MLDVVLAATHVERVGHVCCRCTIGVATRKGELDARVGQPRMDLSGNGGDQGLKKGRGGGPTCFLDELDVGELGFAGRWRQEGTACLRLPAPRQCSSRGLQAKTAGQRMWK